MPAAYSGNCNDVHIPGPKGIYNYDGGPNAFALAGDAPGAMGTAKSISLPSPVLIRLPAKQTARHGSLPGRRLRLPR